MTRTLTAVTVTFLLAATGAVSACGDDGPDDGPVDTTGGTLGEEPGVPFDPDVPEGIDTETDEQDNMGFDDDPGGEPGNVTDPVEVDD